jgi:hypothetical protein
MPNEIYHRSNWGNANAEGFGDVYFDAAATNKLYNHSDYYENSNGTDKILRDLSNKASIVLTPTAYSDGSLNTVIPPYQVLPQELVTNGSFDTDSDWNKGTGINISGGSANFTGFSGQYLSQNVLTSGNTYYLSFNVSDYTSGYLTVFGGAGNDISSLFNVNSIGNYTGYFKAGGVNNEIYFGSNFTGSIDNVSVKEIQEADFDFSRGSSATRVNEQGLIESIASNLPRIDYSSGFGSLLLEPSRSNSLNFSEPTSSESSESGITYESFNWNLGFTNCIKFGDNSQTRYRYFTGSIANSTEYTISAFVIMDDLSEPVLGTGSDTGDLIFRVGGQSATTGNLPNVNMGNNIYRLSSVITSTSGGGTTGLLKYSNQSNKGFRIVGFQLEAGSYATSYIPTSGSTVTRSADVANNSGNADLFNDSEGVLYAEIAALFNDSTNRKIAIGTSSNRIIFGYKNSSNQIRVEVISSGSAVFDNSQTIDDVTTFSKFAIKYKQNDFALWINGEEVATDTSGNTPIGLSELAFDDGGSNNFYGNVKCVAVFKEALTDAELQQLTS